MRVLVTGGTGAVGRAATERLVGKGWDVRVIGRRAGVEIPGAEYVPCDITQYDALRQAMAGREAVVHLAAVAAPGSVPAHELFRINTSGTFNVFEAAAAEGVRRIVQASSINAFGCFWSAQEMHVAYLPIDEEHPTYTTDPYSFSKNVIEEIGAYYWRREGISSVALRLPWVHPAGHQYGEGHRRKMQETVTLLDEFAALPADARLRRLAEIRGRVAAFRGRRVLEMPRGEARKQGDNGLGEDRLCRIYAYDRFNFWAFVDERDSAQAIEKALTAAYEGSFALFVNDSHNWLDYDSRALAHLLFPEVTQWQHPLRGSESLVSIDKARALIGFEPEHSVVAPPAGAP